MSRLWQALESVNAPAVGAEWRKRVGDEFEVLRSAFLRADGDPATSHPCSAGCGCQHRAVHYDDGRIVAVCRCDPPDCDSFSLNKADLIAYGIHWTRLGRAIANAFGCDFKPADTGVHGVQQIATFSGVALPLFLVVQTEPGVFRDALAYLSASAKQPFVVLAPTGRWMDARGHALIGSRCGFFDLESHVILLANGSLRCNRPGGELLSRFLPEKLEPLRQSEAARIFAILTKLRATPGLRKAHPATVFDLLVLQGLNQNEAAKAFRPRCAPSLISERVRLIEREFGMSIKQLRDHASDLREQESAVKQSVGRKRKAVGHPRVEEVEAGADESEAPSEHEFHHEGDPDDD